MWLIPPTRKIQMTFLALAETDGGEFAGDSPARKIPSRASNEPKAKPAKPMPTSDRNARREGLTQRRGGAEGDESGLIFMEQFSIDPSSIISFSFSASFAPWRDAIFLPHRQEIIVVHQHMHQVFPRTLLGIGGRRNAGRGASGEC